MKVPIRTHREGGFTLVVLLVVVAVLAIFAAILAPSFGNPQEILTLEHWHVAPGDVVEPGQALARIARADGSTIEQRATDLGFHLYAAKARERDG